jgi:hypothetical protein
MVISPGSRQTSIMLWINGRLEHKRSGTYLDLALNDQAEKLEEKLGSNRFSSNFRKEEYDD